LNCIKDNFICKRFNSAHPKNARSAQVSAIGMSTPILASTSSQPPKRKYSGQSAIASCSMRETRLNQLLSRITKVSIGIDIGSSKSAVVYSVETTASERKVHICKDSILSRLRVVTFADFDTQAATLISYGKVSQDDTEERFLFGNEVVDALDRKTIVPSQVIRWLKIALFDTSQSGLEHRCRIEVQIGQLPEEARYTVTAIGRRRLIDCIDLLSLYLGYLWRSTLRHISKKEKCQLSWPDLPNQHQYRGVEALDVEFDIAIAIPALAQPAECDLVLKAARMAGLVAPSLFSEPSLAAYYLLQRDFEDGNPPTSQVVLVVDIGAGTAVWHTTSNAWSACLSFLLQDLQIYDIPTIDPLRMNDDVEGEGEQHGVCHRRKPPIDSG
jgi:hypothetical protein